MHRRVFALLPAAALRGAGAVRREVFRASPRPGVAVMAFAWYTGRRGGAMMSIEQHWTRSDTIDVAYVSYSSDHGRTWHGRAERLTGERTPQGMLRRHLRGGWVEPRSGRFIEIWNEGVLPSDDPLEGLRQWNLYYRLSPQGPIHQVIHRGAEFNAEHPLPGVWRGKNSVMLGDSGYNSVTLTDGTILLPVAITPLAPDGSLYNPGGGYTYHDSAVLRGRWRGQTLEWEISERIQGDPARSSRGMVEPTIAALDDRRLLLVMRGANDKLPDQPSYKWTSLSSDGGRTWTKPAPWTYDDGTAFFSPSACSQLLPHSSGRLFWLGNIAPVNPRGNQPRYPFVIAEVDRATGRLLRSTVRAVDDRQPGEDAILTLSNFYAREDRETKEIALHMTRLFAYDKSVRPAGWEGDAFLYRIPVA